MSCLQTIQDYGLRAIGIGERLLPREDFTLCEQFTLIGSGMIWNVYFGLTALVIGFFIATALALGKASPRKILRKPSEWFIFIFRGSPLFIQFFFAYFLYGALQSIPKGDVEAADAYGLSGWSRFRRVIWPTMMRLAWPAYTNEAIFLFHATTLVYISSFPALQQRGDALYYASYFADKTFNPFIPYPILAGYFILLTLVIISVYGLINRRLNRHLPSAQRKKMRLRLNLIR